MAKHMSSYGGGTKGNKSVSGKNPNSGTRHIAGKSMIGTNDRRPSRKGGKRQGKMLSG